MTTGTMVKMDNYLMFLLHFFYANKKTPQNCFQCSIKGVLGNDMTYYLAEYCRPVVFDSNCF